MPRRAAVAAVYAAGLLQGLALVTFPAASAIFTSPRFHGLSNAEYGAMFLPQTVMAVAAALLGTRLARRFGDKRTLLAGLAADLASMALLVVSRLAFGAHGAVLAILCASTALMGVGFGLVVPATSTLAAAFFPERVDAAVLTLNALLGLGTALAPVLVAAAVGLGLWWALPAAIGVGLVALLALTLPLPFAASARGDTGPARARGALFWGFAAFALLYGVVEVMNGNWALLYMKDELGADARLASAALTLFWAAATAGRVLFAGVERWLPGPVTFRLLPWVVGAAFVATALAQTPALGAATFALAGLGCSALLPLTISLGRGAASPGVLIATYQVGYGLGAFGVGPLHARGLGLRPLFGASAGIAVALALLALVLMHARARANRVNLPAL